MDEDRKIHYIDVGNMSGKDAVKAIEKVFGRKISNRSNIVEDCLYFTLMTFNVLAIIGIGSYILGVWQ